MVKKIILFPINEYNQNNRIKIKTIYKIDKYNIIFIYIWFCILKNNIIIKLIKLNQLLLLLSIKELYFLIYFLIYIHIYSFI